MDIGHQPPAQTRPQAFFDRLQIRRRFIRRNDHLTIAVNQGVEGVEELLLEAFLALDELDL